MKLQGSISASEAVNGDIQRSNSLMGSLNNIIGGFDKYVSNIRLVDKILYLDFNDNTSLSVDLSSLSGGSVPTGLTQEQIEAINNMVAILEEDLILEYDEELLDIEFKIENGNMIVTNNVTGLDFSINENGEMEAMY